MPYSDGSEPAIGDVVECVQRIDRRVAWMGLMTLDVGQHFRVIGFSVSKPAVDSCEERSYLPDGRVREITIALATMPPSRDEYWPVSSFRLVSRKPKPTTDSNDVPTWRIDAQAAAETLSLFPTTSTKHMWHEEREDGVRQMLLDLHRLATDDGCIAAAWAFEFAVETAKRLSQDKKGET